MQATEKAGLIKLFEKAYLIALKETSFSDCSSLQKIHEVKFLEKYKNRNSCREFIDYTKDYFPNKDVKNELLRTNFIGILNDGPADKATVEQEVICITFLNPNNFESSLTFFTISELFKESQDAPGLKKALLKSFEDHNIEGLLKKIVFLASDRASPNSSLKSDLIALIKQDIEWASFICCFSHR